MRARSAFPATALTQHIYRYEAKWLGWLRNFAEHHLCRALSRQYSIGDKYRRIYFFHIRKAGGTSVNYGFLQLSGKPSAKVYDALADVSPRHRLILENRIFVGWNKQLIEEGNFFYAFSHLPYHQLNLPINTFTFTCIRDPIARIVSHYKMLKEYQQSDSFRDDYEREVRWLGNSFSEFLENIPYEHLLSQLYMFSPDYNVDEAFARIANLSHFFITEDFAEGIARLSEKVGCPIESLHTRQATVKYQPSRDDLAKLKRLLEPELELYGCLKERYFQLPSNSEPQDA